MAITFQVSDVAIEREPLPTAPVERVLARRGVGDLEGLRCTASALVDGPSAHGLVMAAHLAFARHLPLVIAPDDVWACIAQGFALHVAASGEALRRRLVRHEGKVELVVVRDAFVLGGDNDWGGVADELVEKMRGHLLLRSDLLTGGFSTTGPVERVGAEVALLAAMREFFSYTVLTRCGIPEVTLLGTVADWEAVRQRAELLREFDLGWWVDAMAPALDELARAAAGNPDPVRWRSLYKHESASGSEWISGWILTLLPYIEATPGVFTRRNPAVLGVGKATPTELLLTALPPGVAVAPFRWRYELAWFPMDFGAGLVGATQDPRTGAVRAAHAWWVAHEVSARFVVDPLGDGAVRARLRDPKRVRALSGLWPGVREASRVELVLEGCERLTELADTEQDIRLRSLTLRDNAALTSLRGVQRHANHLEELVVDGAPALRDLRALQGLYRPLRLTLSRCASLDDVRPLTRSPLARLTVAGCPRLPEEFHGDFEGEALTTLLGRITERMGRARRWEVSGPGPTAWPAVRPPRAMRWGPQTLEERVGGERRERPPLSLTKRSIVGALERGPLLLYGGIPRGAVAPLARLRIANDVALVRGDERLAAVIAAWPEGTALAEQPGEALEVTEAPLWVAEVYDAGDDPAWRARRMDALADVGAAWVWALDADAGTLIALRRDGRAWRVDGAWTGDAVVRAAPFEGVELALFDLWCDFD